MRLITSSPTHLPELTGFDRILPVAHFHGSYLPFLAVKDEFLAGDGLGAFREMDMAHLAVDFGAERGGDPMQARGGDFLDVAFFNFLLEPFELACQDLPAFVALAEDALGGRLGLGGAEVGDLELMAGGST